MHKRPLTGINGIYVFVNLNCVEYPDCNTLVQGNVRILNLSVTYDICTCNTINKLHLFQAGVPISQEGNARE